MSSQFGNPTGKHDLLCPRLPPDDQTLMSSMGFSDTAQLFSSLEQTVPNNLKVLGNVYSHSDSPSPPISRQLLVIGVADSSLAVVRTLVGEDAENTPACLHKCHISVKRADGKYATLLKEKDSINTKLFSKFMRRLQQEGAVAIVGCDKYQRFGILQPSKQLDVSSGEWQEEDFFAVCYIGALEEVKEYVKQRAAPETVDLRTKHKSEELWEPPGATRSNGELSWGPSAAKEEISSTNLWQPPSSESTSFDPSNEHSTSWKPLDAKSFSTNNVTTNGGTKRKREKDGFHEDSTAAAADTFYSGLTRSLDTRADSRLYHMRAFNGWVKATQIQELDPKSTKGPLRVLDLACGKGGDLTKWVLHPRGIKNYVGLDVARGSLRDAALRARKLRNKLKQCTFTCADLGSDVPGRPRYANSKSLQKLLTWSLHKESENEYREPQFKMLRGGGVDLSDKFDVVSIQFAIHYMMSTRRRARRFFKTVSELLDIGGDLIVTTTDARVILSHLMNLALDLHFDNTKEKEKDAIIELGGEACQIRFTSEILKRIFTSHQENMDDDDLFGLEYSFTLVEGSDHEKGVGDAVNLPEWLTPIPVIKSLADEAGLELVYAQNFHEYFATRSDPGSNAAAHSSLYNMKVLNRNGSISSEEWEISRLYIALKFRKVRDSDMSIDELDRENSEDENGDSEEDNAAIDPVTKEKLMPMAMIKAKKSVGDETWKTLSPEEKTCLVESELRKLAS